MPNYTNTEPAAGTIIALSQPKLLGNTQYLNQMLSTDHDFTTTGGVAPDGYHKLVHLEPQVVAGALANYGRLYAKTDGSGDQQLAYMDNNAVETMLTGTAVAAANGSITLAVGIIIKWGSFHMAGATANVVFPIAYPNNCWVVSCQQQTVNVTNENSAITAKNVAGFSLHDKAGNDQFYIAIGN